jgi:hypothetical protein
MHKLLLISVRSCSGRWVDRITGGNRLGGKDRWLHFTAGPELGEQLPLSERRVVCAECILT